jgi:ribonuclease VapC
VIPFDPEQAKIVASLWKATRVQVLSLGDRVCLAVGFKAGRPVLTAERAWAKLEVGVSVWLIR